MIPYIYVVIFIAWAIVSLGFALKDYTFLMIGAILVMVTGVNIAINGLAGTNDLPTQALASIHIGLAAYIMIKSSMEAYNG